MGQPLSTSTSIVYSTTGICTRTTSATAFECQGVWTAAGKTCTEWKPVFTPVNCAPGTWKPVAGQTQPPFTVVTTTVAPVTTRFAPVTTPAPTPDPACACTSGQGCADSTCKSCVVSKVCTKVFPTKDECLAVTNNTAKWCGN